jgi:adenylosuccinate synthase
MLNGVTELNMTKSDVLSHFDTLKICTAYKINGKETQEMPFDINQPVEPVYKEMPSWKVDITGMRKKEELPPEMIDYINFIESAVNVPVSVISVGPDREQFVPLK